MAVSPLKDRTPPTTPRSSAKKNLKDVIEAEHQVPVILYGAL
jgi:hypothetical protein